jgi:hypothetical protein
MLACHLMSNLPAQPKLSRVLATFSSFSELEKKERSEWQAMTPLARLQSVETMRQLNHSGYDPATARLQRFYTVA